MHITVQQSTATSDEMRLAALLDVPPTWTPHTPPGPASATTAWVLRDVCQLLDMSGELCVVILGEPGAGKTTTLRRLARELAQRRLHDPLDARIPFLVDLDCFCDSASPAEFLQGHWNLTNPGMNFADACARGQVCFLFDGLNRMPARDRDERIEGWRRWVYDARGQNWAVFTSRTADYVSNLGISEVRLQRLDTEQVRRYLDLRLDAERSSMIWHDFEARLRSDAGFSQLVGNPLSLWLLTEHFERHGEIAASRAGLLSSLIKRRLSESPSASVNPLLLSETLQKALSQLAYALQEQGEGACFTLDFARRVPLRECPLSWEQVLTLACEAALLEASKDRESCVFSTPLLQEYYAAHEFLRRFRSGEVSESLWRVPWRTRQFAPKQAVPGDRLAPAPVTGWEETVRLAADLADQDAGRLISAVAHDNLPLAGRCLAGIGAGCDDLSVLVEEIRTNLLTRQRDSRAHLRARIDAGLALGDLGHPDLRSTSFEVEGGRVWAICPPLQPVPAGAFLYGSKPGQRHAFDDEYAVPRDAVLAGYTIGRFPVTNAEYRHFMEDGGYREERWWSELGRTWKRGELNDYTAAVQDWLQARTYYDTHDMEAIAQRRGWRPQTLDYWKKIVQLSKEQAEEHVRLLFARPTDQPAFWSDPVLGSPLRPVVGVNWYEADAYCRWLSAVTGFTYRLLREVEWEKAARGRDGKEYPWGATFSVRRCNTIESHIYTTTPVGLYADGISSFGVFDASGNVWEWTLDWYQAYPGSEDSEDFGQKFKAVRGGAWLFYRGLARCASRNRYAPDYFSYYLGFRLLCPGGKTYDPL